MHCLSASGNTVSFRCHYRHRGSRASISKRLQQVSVSASSSDMDSNVGSTELRLLVFADVIPVRYLHLKL